MSDLGVERIDLLKIDVEGAELVSCRVGEIATAVSPKPV